MQLINMTPHDITILEKKCLQQPVINRVIPASGQVARCEVKQTIYGYLGGVIPVYRTSYGEVTGLAAPKEGIYYLVSAVVAQACKQMRHDLLVPSGFVRDVKGNILGCTALADFSTQP